MNALLIYFLLFFMMEESEHIVKIAQNNRLII